MFLLVFLACTSKDAVVDDTGDTGATADTFPCDADYFPVDFSAKSYDYTEYSGRFTQVTGSGVRSLEFLSLYEGTLDTAAPESMTGCVFNQVVPLGLGGAYTVYGIDSDWVYVLGDGDRKADGDAFYLYTTPIPLLPLAPEDGWQDHLSSEYDHPDFEGTLTTGVDARVLATSAELTVSAGTYPGLLEMSWRWQLLDGQKRARLDLDITAYFSPDEGLIRQSWYDALDDSSGLIELSP